MVLMLQLPLLANLSGGTNMPKFIIVTFILLGWAFFEMSGGTDFVPETRTTEVADAAPTTASEDIQVSRASNASLVPLASASARQPQPQPDVLQASLATETVSDSAFDLTAEEATTLAVAASQEDTMVEPVDLRTVAGSWVNMRSGSGTQFPVLDTLQSGTEVEVLEISDNGWAHLRVTDSGLEGWMAERLLDDG